MALHLCAVTVSPVYLNQDELGYALNGHALANGHINMGTFPLYFSHLEGQWVPPLVVYTTALFLTMLPLSEVTIRLPNALAGMLDVALIYLLARRVFGARAYGLAAAALLATSPLHFIHSRMLLDHLYPVPFVLGWLLLMYRVAEGKGGPWTLFASGLVLGIGVYTYHAAKVLMPLYLLATLTLVGFRAPGWKHFAATLAGFLLVMLPHIPWLEVYPDSLSSQFGHYGSFAGSLSGSPLLSVDSLLFRLRTYLGYFSPSLLFATGETSLVHTTGRAGVFLLALAPAMALGIWRLVVQHSAFGWLLLWGFFTSPVAAALVGEHSRMSRGLVILPFGVLLAMVGVHWLATHHRPVLRKAPALLAVLVVVQLAVFLQDYWTDYRSRSAEPFRSNLTGALRAVVAEDQRVGAQQIYLDSSIVLVDLYWQFVLAELHHPGLRAKTVLFPPDRPAEIPPNSLVLLPANQLGRLTPDAPQRLLLGPNPRLFDVATVPDGTGSFYVYRSS